MLYEIKLEFVILGEQTDEWIIRMPLDKSSDDSGDVSVKTQVCSVDLEMGARETSEASSSRVLHILHGGRCVGKADTASKQIRLFLQASLL